MRVCVATMSSILLAATGCLAEVQKSGGAQTETRDVPDFHSVSVASGIHAVISIGPRRPLELEGDRDVLAVVETRVEDGQLQIGFKRHRMIWTSHEVKVVIQTPDLDAIDASGGSDVRAELTGADETEGDGFAGARAERQPRAASMDIQASGGGEVHARGLDAGSLRVQGSGGAVIELRGRADEVRIEMSGGTHVKGAGLSVKNVRIEGSGGSQAELRASGRIRGGLSGGSELHIRGGASSRVATSGGSSVELDD